LEAVLHYVSNRLVSAFESLLGHIVYGLIYLFCRA
jgi:hypothetical protein